MINGLKRLISCWDWLDFIGRKRTVIHQCDIDISPRSMHLGYGALLNVQSLGEVTLGAMSCQVLPKGYGLHRRVSVGLEIILALLLYKKQGKD
ncbi:ATP-dependent Zn protease [Pseudomonas syringae pv. actinidiae]|uniref:ATP-dependent Zn protease n=1 Tax=Pseudomonas syringae pv. actinidiae TaxID=103796 RepID=A0A2V0Q871_PSESF|nr:ATP-dependent Zn protease [Pseudomonas syringae pv. actinidiae]